MARVMRCAAIAALSAACITLIGCSSDPTKGYAFNATFDRDVETVAVPIFDNTTFFTALETTLTDAVVKRIQIATPWRVTDAEIADTTLSGTITRARLLTLSNSRAVGLPEEQALTLTVDFTWRDNRTGELLASKREFAATSTFVPATGVDGQPGERIEIGQRSAIDELAEAIVNDMRQNW